MSFSFNRMDKKKKRGVKDWPKKHAKYITEFKVMVDKLDWEHQHGGVQEDERPHDAAAFDVYLSWLTPRTRVKLLPQAFTSDDIRIASNPEGFDLAELPYNKKIREHCQRQELAPVVNFMVCFLFHLKIHPL